MKVNTFNIEGPLLIYPRIFEDSRGCFLEYFNEERYNDLIENVRFVQDNISISAKGVVRGLHFQVPPFAQGKLVSVLRGAVLDVIVDIRRNSTTYGQHIAVELTESEYAQLWIPPGFAHGFAALEEKTIFSYKCTAVYEPSSEGTLRWNDADLAINWNLNNPIVSEKDELGEFFKTFVSPFE
jgi:dTDP-4-dehydrorhamnose 3,5-epimerase